MMRAGLRCLAACGIAWTLTLWAVMPRAEAQPPENNPPTAADAARAGSTEAALREQSIYIPYSKLRDVFEKQGRGVFLPYDKFQALWQAARQAKVRDPEAKPPVGALVTEIDSQAVVGKEVVQVTAELKVEVLTTGWSEVPLRLADAALLSAELDGKPARLLFDEQQGYRLLIEKKEQPAAQYLLQIEYAKAFTKSPGQNSVSFQAPQAPINRWQIRVPEAGIKVNIHPLIAATEVPAQAENKPDPKPEEKPEDKPENAGATVVQAFVGGAPQVRFDWTPKSEGASGLEALATVQSQHEMQIEEGVVRTRTRLDYSISRAELSRLELEVPGDQKVVNVYDPNVRQWAVEKAGDVQKIVAQLFEPVRGTQQVTVDLESYPGEMPSQTIAFPVVKALGVGRQQGVVVVRVAAALRGEPVKTTGLLQLDSAELPSSMSKGSWEFAYRFAAVPFDLTLSVEKLQPRLQVDSLTEVFLEPEDLTLLYSALYRVERAGVFQLELDIPPGYEARQVQGRAIGEHPAVQVDTFHLSGDDKTHLVVNLAAKVLGPAGLLIELHRRLEDPNLMTPTGMASDLALSVPQPAGAGVERSSGKLVVYAPESLRINHAPPVGLGPLSFADAFQQVSSARGDRCPTLRPVLAFNYSKQAASLTLSVDRRKPHVTVRQLLVAQVEPGVVKYTATFRYDILYSSVKSVRIDLPERLAELVRNQSSSLREERIAPPPADLSPGYIAWRLTGETDLSGQVVVVLAWEEKIERLEVGKSQDLAVPVLLPREADRAWGQIVVGKAETVDVRAGSQPQGLRPIDPQRDLMDGTSVPNATGAFEFHADWSLTLLATRYQLEVVKRTSIDRAWIRTVATRSQQVAVQALYRLRSAQQRLAVQLPGQIQFDTEPLRINGRPVALERGDQDELFIPLVGQNPDEAFLLELRYTVPGQPSRLDYPIFPERPALQKVYLSAYVPEELVLLGSRGPWNQEMSWVWQSSFSRVPVPLRSDQDLAQWVSEGLSLAAGPLDSFQIDGHHLLFSTLQPVDPPDGSLRLSVLKENWLSLLVFVVVGAAGVLLLRRPITYKVMAVAAGIALLVAVGVFMPTLSTQLLDGVLWSVAGLVLLLWLVGGCVCWWQHRPPQPLVVDSAVAPFVPSSVVSGEAAAAVAPSAGSPPQGSPGGGDAGGGNSPEGGSAGPGDGAGSGDSAGGEHHG